MKRRNLPISSYLIPKGKEKNPHSNYQVVTSTGIYPVTDSDENEVLASMEMS